MSQAGSTEPTMASCAPEWPGRTAGGPRTRWLRTSPEYPLKRLLAAGLGDCYELGRVFRDGEAGGRHNPEFTMLEWYRVGMDHVQLAAETAELVRMALALVGREASVESVTYRDLYLRELGIDPMTASDETLRDALGDVVIDPQSLVRDDWLDLLMTHRIQPGLSPDAILVVLDYPASQCALARIREPDHATAVPVAARFELYLGPLELANGYHELADADEQPARFEPHLVVRPGPGPHPPALHPTQPPHIAPRIQPALSPDAILVVLDYPASQCALARIREPDHATAVPVAERFELYLGPLELANGYHELADADEQRARFERDLVVRQGRGLQPPAIDENLLAALAHGLPGCAGVALGMDRLLMAMLGTDAIEDVLAFDFARG